MKRTKKGFYVCEVCGMKYEQEIHARNCENWCKEHHSCNIEIIANAITEEK